ncbi:unnamed protein product [Phytophthora fragariaefolia]|uniref:Unnamed protein product n=1 Tax=Phytophthora fragariaefolia TaxID=1490495 RepID=A0A9W6XYQ7_9STRA|nr:unnamed protein product [Phytophthora fragariaefolia]
MRRRERRARESDDHYDKDNNWNHSSNNEKIGWQPPGGLLAGASTPNQEGHDGAETQAADELEDMSWWDALTPGKQRSMMRRFMATPSLAAPATAAAPQRIHVPMVEQPKRSKPRLGGDEWTVDERYHGAVQHLKGKAEKWFITWSHHVPLGDETFAYLVKKMRGKYGRRDNAFRIQQRLGRRQQQPGERLSDFADSRVDIGFGQNVPDDTYREAFLIGMNNKVIATQIRMMKPETMEDAVQMSIGTCGEYGEGLSVTDWKTAQRRYRTDRGSSGEDAGLRKKAAKLEMASQFDWKKLGLVFGSEAQPMYDTSGEAVSGLSETAKKDPLSLATIRALMVMVGVGDKATEANEPGIKPAAGKSKAWALEVKAERTAEAAGRKEEPSPRRHEWQPQAAGVGGRGYGGNACCSAAVPPERPRDARGVRSKSWLARVAC